MDMDIERALKNIGDWISKETESRKYPKGELLELSESLQALKAEIARQSVTSEEVAEAIAKIEKIVVFDNEHGYRVNNHHSLHISDIKTALTALQAYQPWIPVGERLPEEGAIVMVAYGEAIYFASIQYWGIHGKEVPVWRVGMGHRIEKDFNETHWKPYPETPKGE